MSYTSQADLIERYGTSMLLDLADRADPPAGVIDVNVVARAIDDACAVIDGYLLGRYALPLVAVPPQVCDLAQSLAIYKLHRDSTSDKIQRDYDSAIATLKLIATGTVRLDIAGVEPTASGASGVRVTDRARDLTPSNLRGFV